VYRLLAEFEAQARTPAVLPPAPIPVASDESREAAIARADLAEQRERIHQERWAREIDQLRARVTTADAVARDLREALQRIADLSRALASAQQRISQLEQARDERAAVDFPGMPFGE
jgi:predicted RNase H-like nuclease (RuvC/YqgF family)